jgi:dihydrodiol dehydrogenase / D-xylose 1-dehydrogenase (NADP)
MIAIQKALHDDQVIGDVTALYTNLSLNAIGRRPDTDRVLAAELGGGALLDLGPYPWTWVSYLYAVASRLAYHQSMMLLYHHPKNKKAAPESVSSTMLKHTTGVDLDTLWGMTFPNLTAMAHCEWQHLNIE